MVEVGGYLGGSVGRRHGCLVRSLVGLVVVKLWEYTHCRWVMNAELPIFVSTNEYLF